MASITINDFQASKYYGIYDNGGTWTQSDALNFATHFAVLDEIPGTNGIFDGTVYAEDDTYYEADYTFNVTFSPVDESRVTADFTPVEFQATGVGVLEPADFNINNRILRQYQ